MAATPRRQLNNYRFYDCALHGTYKVVRGQNGYTYEPTQAGQVALEIDIYRPDENARGYTICALCGFGLNSRSIVDYATGREESRHECGPKCRSATGPNCECQCKGQNHGAA